MFHRGGWQGWQSVLSGLAALFALASAEDPTALGKGVERGRRFGHYLRHVRTAEFTK